MARVLITQKKLNRIIAEAHQQILHEASARSIEWKNAVQSIAEALFGPGIYVPDYLEIVDKRVDKMNARFRLTEKSSTLTEDEILEKLNRVFAVEIGEPKSLYDDLMSSKYKTYYIQVSKDQKFRAVFIIEPLKRKEISVSGVPKYSEDTAENSQINAMNDAIKNAIGEGTEGISIYMGKGPPIENVGAVIKEEENSKAKADAFFVPMVNGIIDKTKPLAYISLKNAANPSKMYQWGGVSAYATELEVANFIIKLKQILDESPRKNEISQNIAYQSSNELSALLSQKICWGKNWPSDRGKNKDAVSMIYVSTASSVRLVFKDKNNYYEFAGGIQLYDGTIPSNEWAPYLLAKYSPGRNDFGIKHCRLGVFPKEHQKNTIIIFPPDSSPSSSTRS